MTDVTSGSGAVTEATAIGLYLIYAFLAVGLVAFLARTLQRNGQVFLERTFDREELATAVNQLLVIGFYLLNMGYALLVYRLQPSYPSLVDAFNQLVGRLGLLLLSLGVIHLANMAIFWRIGGSAGSSRRSSVAVSGMAPPAPPPPVVVGSYPLGETTS